MAANDVYFKRGTLLGTWNDTTGATTLALNGVSAGAGEHGDRLDIGGAAGDARPPYLWVEAGIRWTTPVVDELAGIWLCNWDESGSNPSHPGIATTAASLAGIDELKGLDHVMNVIAGSTTSANTFMRRRIIHYPYKYITPVVWNGAGSSGFVASNDVSWVSIYQAVYQRQTS